MKRLIKEYKKEGYVQITTVDERWYDREGKFYPSVTWICDYYPKGIAFYKWLAQKGWNEAEAIKTTAGDKGSKVHAAIVDLLDNKEVKIDSKYFSELSNQEEELTPQEYECLMSFVNWFKAVKPKVIAREFAVFNDGYNYAGTVDLLCLIDDKPWIIDFKTGKYIWPSWELQVSAYKYGEMNTGSTEEAKLGILQLGYNRNKNKYKFTEIQDKFDLFLAAKSIFESECAKIQPKQLDFPLSLKLEA